MITKPLPNLAVYALLLLLIFSSAGCSKESQEEIKEPKVAVTLNKVLFTDPEKVKLRVQNSPEILDQLITYFDASSTGSTIYVGIYLFDYPPIIAAIIRTHLRGVNIHVLIDHSRDESMATNVDAIQRLQPILTGNSSLTIVNNDVSSGASGSINHHKFVLFSALDIKNEGVAKNVVFASSSNWTAADMKKIQDAVIISDEAYYNAFLSNWNTIKKYATSGMKNFNYQVFESADKNLNAYFFPRLTNGVFDGGDTILEILDKISDFSNATVQVGMSDWVDSRIVTVKKLIELLDKGVKVEVIAKSSAGALVQKDLELLRSKGAYVKILVLPINIHTKFMLIKGKFDGQNSEVIVTGTHNFTTNALRSNNEVILLLKNNPMFKDYQDYYLKLKNTFN
ncbi:phospholipase D-like domain-containing protein [Pedobacter immunditicola]|uniref:phospholipase D-like domain-containing protein n=1 Tax=Pedobacter immunditicola TaxID=3133440 RepID=UPI00309C3FF4